MNPLSIFTTVEHWMKNFLVTAVKAEKVFTTLTKDMPVLLPLLKDFWAKSLSLAAATSTAFNDKGFNIPADSAEFAAVKAWLVSLKSMAAGIEAAYKDAAVIVEATAPAAIAVPFPPILAIPK